MKSEEYQVFLERGVFKFKAKVSGCSAAQQLKAFRHNGCRKKINWTAVSLDSNPIGGLLKSRKLERACPHFFINTT